MAPPKGAGPGAAILTPAGKASLILTLCALETKLLKITTAVNMNIFVFMFLFYGCWTELKRRSLFRVLRSFITFRI